MIKFPPTKTYSFQYAKKHIRSRLLKSGLGLITIIAVIFGLPALWWLDAIFTAIGVLFAIYLWQTIQQMNYAVVADKTGISFGKQQLAWEDIKTLKLRHYGGNKHSTILGASFFQLTLRGGNRKISFDSDISDFKDLLSLAVGAIGVHSILIDEATAHNIGYFQRDE